MDKFEADPSGGIRISGPAMNPADQRRTAIVSSYDAVADEYAAEYFHELDAKPFDRQWLDGFATSVARGRVCDLGCGPGHIARYLAGRGVDVFGIDASMAMVVAARRLNPTLSFFQGDFLHLDLKDCTLGGITAFYSLIHCARTDLARALAEIFRILQPGGRLLMAVHAGGGEVGREEWFGKRVTVVATLFSEDEVRAALMRAGFRIDEMISRPPYEFEYPSSRIYAVATRPFAAGDLATDV